MSNHGHTTHDYEGLRTYFRSLPEELDSIDLTFDKLESVIGRPLPAEAAKSEWWNGGSNQPKAPQSSVCELVGFSVAAIAMPSTDNRGWILFNRGVPRWPDLYVTSDEVGQLPIATHLRQLAAGYLQSGKVLCSQLGENPGELTWPRGAVVCFCYRHAVELFLQACIVHSEPVEKCNHNISSLRKQYDKLYPGADFHFSTPWDIDLQEVEQLLGGELGIEDFERHEDQVYRYFSDKHGRMPKSKHLFSPGLWLLMIERLEVHSSRIWSHILSTSRIQ
jgi:hypothetical protein